MTKVIEPLLTFEIIYPTVVTYTQKMVESVSIIATCIMGITIFQIYKPPNDNWFNPVLLATVHPSFLADDFNNHHITSGYNENEKNGNKLCKWIHTEDF